MKFLVLGGYGNTGLAVTELLLRETDIKIVLAGRNFEKADQAASNFNLKYPGDRISARYADASDPASLETAFGEIDLVVVASSTSKYVSTVANAAIQSGIDYIDPHYSKHKTRILSNLESEIIEKGCCFITEGGFHPGLPAALVRYVAPEYDRLEVANVGSVIKIDWPALELGPETMEELVCEFFNFKPVVFKDRKWQSLGIMSMLKPVWFEFGEPFGRQYCIAMDLEEMHALPDLFSDLQETGFFVGGFNWFTDWIISPLVMIIMKFAPVRGIPAVARLMDWGLKTFSSPPYGTLLKLETYGVKDGKPLRVNITVEHEDGYMLTAIPIVACLLQYIDDEIKKPGLWYQALIVDPTRFMADMERMGARIKTLSAPEIN